MGEIREIFRSFAQVKGFDGWMIGKLRFSRGRQGTDAAPGGVVIRKKKRNYAVMEIASAGMAVQMYLIYALQKRVGERGQTGAQRVLFSADHYRLVVRRVFSQQEVVAFVDDVGDGNGIHRSENPVVPGGVIAEWLWAGEISCGREDVPVSGDTFTMTFVSPVYAGEEIRVYQDSVSGRLWGTVRRGERMELVWKWERRQGDAAGKG